MRVSRRQFFTRLRDAAEGPERWRERRIQELKEYALGKAPAAWKQAWRDDLARTVEEKLVYMSDDSLRERGVQRYVDAILNAKTLYHESGESEDDPYYQDDPYSQDNTDYLG